MSAKARALSASAVIRDSGLQAKRGTCGYPSWLWGWSFYLVCFLSAESLTCAPGGASSIIESLCFQRFQGTQYGGGGGGGNGKSLESTPLHLPPPLPPVPPSDLRSNLRLAISYLGSCFLILPVLSRAFLWHSRLLAKYYSKVPQPQGRAIPACTACLFLLCGVFMLCQALHMYFFSCHPQNSLPRVIVLFPYYG